MMGMVTDIQRFSLKDGPGIRTTVFLKGCNAACSWCHNPETLSMERELLVYPERCARCGACVGFDPALAAQGLPPPRARLSLAGAELCFSGALSIAGREMSAREVLDQVEQDIEYYQNSGGGVTLSGGEACMQQDFAAEILRLCKQKGIAAAIETNLAYDFSRLEGLLPFLDLVMADIKIFDPRQHREFTGIGNEQILENAARLAQTGIPYILRTPVIPGINDTLENIGAIAAFIAGNRTTALCYYELLNFNPLGASKYEGLGLPNQCRAGQPLSGEAIGVLVGIAASADIPVRVG